MLDGIGDRCHVAMFVPWNKLSQMADTSICDPNLKQLKSYLNTLSKATLQAAVASTSARSGTQSKRMRLAHSSRRDARFGRHCRQRELSPQHRRSSCDAALRIRGGVIRARHVSTTGDADVPPDIAALLKKHGGS
jgi:hypothetical protein